MCLRIVCLGHLYFIKQVFRETLILYIFCNADFGLLYSKMNIQGVAVSEEHRFDIFFWDIRLYRNIMILWVNIFI